MRKRIIRHAGLQRGSGGCKLPAGVGEGGFRALSLNGSRGRRDFPLQKAEAPLRGNSGGTAEIIRPESKDSGLFCEVKGLLVNQMTLDKKAMVSLARISRKTLRNGRSSPVRRFAWFAVSVELFLAALLIWVGLDGWLTNVLLAAIMLACILSEDVVNGLMAYRQMLPDAREVNVTFKEDHFIHYSRAAETWWNYRQIKAIGEDQDYFALVLDKNHGQIYAKDCFTWGSPDEFREFIQRKTGKKIQKVPRLVMPLDLAKGTTKSGKKSGKKSTKKKRNNNAKREKRTGE